MQDADAHNHTDSIVCYGSNGKAVGAKHEVHQHRNTAAIKWTTILQTKLYIEEYKRKEACIHAYGIKQIMSAGTL
jgi:hypothetical protein